jgi:hypothetical protein
MVFMPATVVSHGGAVLDGLLERVASTNPQTGYPHRQVSDIDTGLAIGGAKLPFETYLTYGTPGKLTLTGHLVQFSSPGAPAGEAPSA